MGIIRIIQPKSITIKFSSASLVTGNHRIDLWMMTRIMGRLNTHHQSSRLQVLVYVAS